MKRLHQAVPTTSNVVDHSIVLSSIAQLWTRGELCDCVLVSSDQHSFPVHKVVLAAASQYFKVLFLGTGQHMLNSASNNDQGTDTVQLDELDRTSLQLVLQAIYQQDFQV